MNGTFKFQFDSDDDYQDAKLNLYLARLSVEGMFGEARVRLESTPQTVAASRSITIDASNEVGEALVKVLTRILIQEFGADGFSVTSDSARAEQNSKKNIAAGEAEAVTP